MIQSRDDAGEQFRGDSRVRSDLVDVESDFEYIGLHELFPVNHAAFVKNTNHSGDSSLDQLRVAMSAHKNDRRTWKR